MDMGLLWAIPCRSMLSVFMSMLFGHSSVHSAFCAASRFVLFCFWFWYWARFRFWFRFWFLFWSFVSSIGRVRALLPSLSLSVECLCLCFDFGLDSILYLIIYCPACAKKIKKKKKEETARKPKGKRIWICRVPREMLSNPKICGTPDCGSSEGNGNTFASSICYYFGSLWFWSLLQPMLLLL